MATSTSEMPSPAIAAASAGGVVDGEAMDQQRPSSLSPWTPVTPSSSCMALRTAVTGLTRIDDFHMELIGQGFFANVYKVRHLVTDEIMVLKLAKRRRSHSSYRSDGNSLREVQIMKALSHPKILRFYGVCVHEGQVHPLVEYINGGVLEELLLDESREIAWPLRFKLSLDISEGMAYLHSMGMFHRDLTSKNVLLRVKGDQMEAVVADFGLAARIPHVKGATLSVVGTPYWMAPEVLNGEAYNEKADVFSFGIILCEILARVGADPENLPRVASFGLATNEFLAMLEGDVPPVLVRLAIHCCQLVPAQRLTFALIVLLLTRHRGRKLYNESISSFLTLHDSDNSNDQDATLGVEELTLRRVSPCCSPQPPSLMEASSNESMLLCLSPPLRPPSNSSLLQSPFDDQSGETTPASSRAPMPQPCFSSPSQATGLNAGPSSRDVLGEYCCAKTVCIPSPDSLSSHSAENSASGGTAFSFSICDSPQPHAGPPQRTPFAPTLLLSPPLSSEPIIRSTLSPVRRAESQHVRSNSDCGGGKSPRSTAARPARHQRSASLSKHLSRGYPSLGSEVSLSAPSSPTSPSRPSSLIRQYRWPHHTN